MAGIGSGLLVTALAVALLALAPLQARAQWSLGGTPVASQPGDESSPVLASDGRGGAVIAWQEFARIRAQRLTADGLVAPGWPEASGLDVCPEGPPGSYMQSGPRIAPDGLGGAFVLWHDERYSDCDHLCFDALKEIYVARIGGDGALAAGWPAEGLDVGSAPGYMLSSAGGGRGRPSDFNTCVAPDGAGGVFIAWREGEIPAWGNPTPGIHVQRVSGDGKLLWGPRGVLACAGSGHPTFPALAPDGAGGAFVLWEDSRDPAAIRTYGQHLTATGRILWVEGGIRLTHGSGPDEQLGAIVSDGHGGAIVAWQAPGVGESVELFAQSVSGDGRLLWANDARVTPAAGPQETPAIAADGARGVWLAWPDLRDPARVGIRAQLLTKRGDIAPGWQEDGLPVCRAPAQRSSHPILVPDGNEGAYVAWLDGANPRVARITRHASMAGGWPEAGAALSESRFGNQRLDMAADGAHGAIVVWEEGIPPTGSYDRVLAQRLLRDRLAASPIKHAARLASGPTESDATPPRLALAGLWPNPARGTLTVSFTIPDDSPVRLELFDLMGRCLAARDVGGLGAGHHLVDLGSSRRVPPGVYVVRLTRSGTSLIARGVVVR